MKLKLDEKGNVVVVDGRPVYVYPDGKEIPFDAEGTVSRISALNLEAKTHREAKEALETQVKAFAGLDPEAARKAVETMKNIDDKKLVDAGKLDEVRANAVKAYEERLKAQETAHANQLNEANTKVNTLTSQLHNELIGGNFSRSKFIATKVLGADAAASSALAQALFQSRFKVEDGKLVAFDAAGNRLHSRIRPGDPNVDFEEAIELTFDAYPHKESILKGSGASGGGAGGGARDTGGKKTISRSQWAALDPAAQASVAKDSVITD